MNFNVFQVLLSQIVRHFLTMAATALAGYGVTADQQSAFVSSTTAVIVSLLLFAISFVWSYVSKVAAFKTPTSF